LGLIFALYPIFKDGLPDIKFSPSSFLLSVLIMLLAYTLLPVIWFFVAQIFGMFISFPDAVFSWYLSSIGRYIPGKVWQFVGRVTILNHPSGSVFSATLYEHLILMAGAGLFSLIFPKFLYIQLGIIFVLLLVLFTWKFSIKTLIPLIFVGCLLVSCRPFRVLHLKGPKSQIRLSGDLLRLFLLFRGFLCSALNPRGFGDKGGNNLPPYGL